MILNNRRKKLIEESMQDYAFINRFLNNEINEMRSSLNDEDLLEYLSKSILRFKDSEITNLENYDNENTYHGYLDFIYKNINMCVYYDEKDEVIVGKAFEIYDKLTNEYIIEDYLTIEEYSKMLNTDKETELANAIVDLKYYDNGKYIDSYNAKRDEIIEFLKENW